jgi:hypothetical protein
LLPQLCHRELVFRGLADLEQDLARAVKITRPVKHTAGIVGSLFRQGRPLLQPEAVAFAVF